MFSLLALLALLPPLTGQDGERIFRDQVAPLLEARCFPCHDAVQAKGELSFESQEPPEDLIVPGDPDSSLLIEMVTGAKPEMPKKAEPLNEEEIGLIRAWIESGGAWVGGAVGASGWWSLQPLEAPTAPELPAQWQSWPRRPLDGQSLWGGSDGDRSRGRKPEPGQPR